MFSLKYLPGFNVVPLTEIHIYPESAEIFLEIVFPMKNRAVFYHRKLHLLINTLGRMTQ